MRKAYFSGDNIITSLGFSTEENAEALLSGITGITGREDPDLYPGPVPVSLVDSRRLEEEFARIDKRKTDSGLKDGLFTRLEKMLICSMSKSLAISHVDPANPRTLIVLSTTKGNIDLIAGKYGKSENVDRIHLWQLARFIGQYFKNPNKLVVVSTACTSGSTGIILAARMIMEGHYDHVIVVGGDIISEFVISGFQSFQALSPGACRPFDRDRAGLSLGEGCGTIILSSEKDKERSKQAVYLGGATSNDANHISGPSRDGEGLYLSVAAAMAEAGIRASEIDFISAHGTATPYNDEMEALALARAGLEKVPVNSLKGYIGHTLGAAGLIETALSIYSINHSILFKSLGYENHGVSVPLNVVRSNMQGPVRKILKTASGFGGSNAAMVIAQRDGVPWDGVP